ncbi:YraN family protein [Martelella alba]|uniref:UPF0102 protein FJU08_09455 n=1 Tax=Martelella alba TaxID=2590451 RepID=A0A506UBW1_9HYPH|nr:YraN family protein [Martelella alba]TPW30886.1 YraN family protein [Martelella alba]
MTREPAPSRVKAERRGRRAEWIAALYLTCKGYRIVAMRYKTPSGEIDLIARKGDLAIFIEVKARKSRESAIDAVSYEAMRRIRAASDLWLKRQKNWHAISSRFDIVAVTPGRLPQHIPNAF